METLIKGGGRGRNGDESLGIIWAHLRQGNFKDGEQGGPRRARTPVLPYKEMDGTQKWVVLTRIKILFVWLNKKTVDSFIKVNTKLEYG
jgi:hypothetical protein